MSERDGGAFAASIGANPELCRVRTLYAAGEWHRELHVGAMGRWIPAGCMRGAAVVTEWRDAPPAVGPVCSACWPVWPDERR